MKPSLALTPLLLLGVLACDSEVGAALEHARERGIAVGFAIEPPYAFVDSAGRITGKAPEMLRHLAAEIGIEDVRWFPLDFGELIPALLAGRIDVIASGMFITAERSERVRFSRPTACLGPILVVRAQAPDEISGAAERVPCPGCRIAVLEGSVEQRALENAGGGVDVLAVPNAMTGIAAVRGRTADALAVSAPTGRLLAGQQAALSTTTLPLPPQVVEAASGCAALAFRLQQEDLAAAFDSALADFLASPAHVRLARPFGFERHELACPPGDGAAADSAGGACHPVPASTPRRGPR